MLFVFFLLSLIDPCAPAVPLPPIAPIIEGVAAATMTGYLVGFYKKAYPAALDRSIVAVAVAAGLLSALVTTMVSGGVHLSQASIGVIIVQGIGAAALSAGVHVINKPPQTMA